MPQRGPGQPRRFISTQRVLARLVLSWLAAALLLGLHPAEIVRADAILTINGTTLPLIGADTDSANFNNGPRNFWVGAQIQNSGNVSSGDLTVTFQWVIQSPDILMIGPTTQTFPSLAPGAKQDVYFYVTITSSGFTALNPASYQIQASAGTLSVATPVTLLQLADLQEDAVETLSASPISGPTNVVIGQTVQFTVQDGAINTNKPGMIVHQLLFPSDMLRILSVSTTYTDLPGTNNDKTFYNACGWSLSTLTCTSGSQNNKVGGTVVSVYSLQVLQAGDIPLSAVVYGYQFSTNTYTYLKGSGQVHLRLTSTSGATTPTFTPTQTPPQTPTRTPTVVSVQPSSTPSGYPAPATATSTYPGPGSVGASATATPLPVSTATRTPTPQAVVSTVTRPPTSAAQPTAAPPPAGVVSLTLSASAAEAPAGGSLSFTLTAVNNTSQPIGNLTITDTLPAGLTVATVSSTKGSASALPATNAIRVTLASLNPGESVNVTIHAKASSLLTVPTSAADSASMMYLQAGQLRSAASNSVALRLGGGGPQPTSLPGTGRLPRGAVAPPELRYPASMPGANADDPAADQLEALFETVLVCGLLLVVLGLGVLGSWPWARQRLPLWAGWLARTGLLLCGAGALFALAAWSIRPQVPQLKLMTAEVLKQNPNAGVWEQQLPLVSNAAKQLARKAEQVLHLSPAATPTAVAALPTPVPATPPAPVAKGNEIEPEDSSPVVRVAAPSIHLDAPVRDIPLERGRWSIETLQNEVAWLEGTSRPGLGGNTGLAGHITLNNGGDGPFRQLAYLKAGAEVLIYTQKYLYVYRVRDGAITSGLYLTALAPTSANTLTLVTCTGWDEKAATYRQRVIMSAELARREPLKSQGN